MAQRAKQEVPVLWVHLDLKGNRERRERPGPRANLARLARPDQRVKRAISVRLALLDRKVRPAQQVLRVRRARPAAAVQLEPLVLPVLLVRRATSVSRDSRVQQLVSG